MIKEIHAPDCRCSYCGNNYDIGLHRGLNPPPQWWSWNAWWVWCSVDKHGNRHYRRYLPLRWLRRLQLRAPTGTSQKNQHG